MMDQAIRDFPKQFLFQPRVENPGALNHAKKFVVAGMGGSNLAPGLLQVADPGIDVVVYRSYGLPPLAHGEMKQRLTIASSYSGNTEETIDAFEMARRKKYPLVVITVGGKLLALAKKYRMPYIQLPDTGIQPRMALGFNVVALLKMMGNESGLTALRTLTAALDGVRAQARGMQLAKTLRGHVPIIYAALAHHPIAYIWKIKFNETGKIPAFCNVFPELNHNEMTGFDPVVRTRALMRGFHFIFLSSAYDHPRVQKRMRICKKLYGDRGLLVTELPLSGKTPWQAIFTSLMIADWTAYYTSQGYGAESEQVPMVEEFKTLMRS